MNLLLDTHSLIWFLNGDLLLPETARKQILDRRNPVFVSIASIWEIAIKTAIGKLDLRLKLEAIESLLIADDIQLLGINYNDALLVSRLPFHHKDPFDRIIAAQALNGQFTLVTKDGMFKKNGVDLLW
jgi:PIN domain nuclease of toxin-antitoxin system